MRSSLREWVVAVGISLLLGHMLCAISTGLRFRTLTRQEAIDHQYAILERRPLMYGDQPHQLPMWRNRILFPSLLKICRWTGLGSENERYLLLRWATCSAMIGAYWVTLRKVGALSRFVAGLGVAMLSFSLILTFFSYPREVPSDVLDAMFVSLFVVATLRSRRTMLLGLALIAATNRESAAFAGIIWACVHGWKTRLALKELAFGALVCFLTYASVVGLRYWFRVSPSSLHDQQPWAITAMFPHLAAALQHPGLISWPVLALSLFGLPTVLIWQGWRSLDRSDYAIFVSMLVITCITLLFGLAHELRVFIPSLTLLAYLSARALRSTLIEPAPC